jgi:F-box and leucine-rich repeat protein GRR1
MLWYKPFLYHTPALIKLLKTLRKPVAAFDYARFLRRINLSFLPEHVADAILLNLSSCRNLERLTLTGCARVTDRGLCDVISRNTGLVALDVHGLSEITDLSILCLARRAANLQGLNLTRCVKIRDDAIMTIAASCANLRRVSNPFMIKLLTSGQTEWLHTSYRQVNQ